MDSQELDQLTQQLKQLNETFSEFGATVNKADQNLGDALGKRFPNAAKPSIAALQGLGNAATDVAAALYKGERGAAAMARGFEQLADGVQTAVAIFTLFTPMGKALSLGSKLLLNGAAMAGKAFATFNKLSAEQSDKLFKTYQDLSKIGAAGAGMEEVFANLSRMGLTSAEIDQYTAVLRRNSRELSGFGASVADGARNLTAVSGAITKGNLGRQLMMLGYSAEDIAQSTATYMSLQVRLGRLQLKSMTEIANESGRYAIELDKLARLTGQAREDQEKEQKSLVEDERWIGFLEQASAAGTDITELQNYLSLWPKEFQRGMQHIIAGGGALSSPEAIKVAQTLPNAYQTLSDLVNQNTKASRAYGKTMGDLNEFSRRTAGSRAVGATEGFGMAFGGQGGLYDLKQNFKAISDNAAKLGMTVDQYIDSEQYRALVADKSTKDQVELRRKQMGAAQSLDSFVNLGVKPATSAMETFATAVDKATSKLPGAPVGGRYGAGGKTGGGGGAAPAGTAAAVRRGQGGGFGSTSAIRDMIGAAESNGNYNTMVGGGQAPLTAMTLNEVLSYQNTLSSQGQGTAAGKYQIINSTLRELISSMGLKGNEKFDSNMQDRMADELIKRRGYGDYTSGKISKEQFLSNLSREWAGLPSSPSGQSYYAGVGNNRATIGWQQAMESFSKGGVFTQAQGVAQLHGPEAIVPLPDGRSIPVEMRGFTDSVNQQMGIMNAQLTRLDELVNVMRNQVGISQKILQHSR